MLQQQHQRNRSISILYSIILVIIISNLNNCACLEPTKNPSDDSNGAPVEGEQKLEEAIELLKEHQTSGVDPVKVVKAGVESIDVDDTNQSSDKGEEEAKLKNNKPVDSPAEYKRPLSSMADSSVINKNVINSPSGSNNEHDRDSDDDHRDFDHRHEDDDDPEMAALNSEPSIMRGINNNNNELPGAPYSEQENDDYMYDNNEDDNLKHAFHDELRRVDDLELDPEEEEYMNAERPLDEDNDDIDYGDDESEMLVGDQQYDPEYNELYDDGEINENLYHNEQEGPPDGIHEDTMLSGQGGLNDHNSVPLTRSVRGQGPPNGSNQANDQTEPYDDSDDDYDDPNGQHYEDSWVDHSDPNGPTLNRLKHDEDVWQDNDGVMHHEKSRHKSSSTINNNADPNNYHEAHQEEHQESKSSVYNGGNSMQRKRSFSKNNSHHYQSNHQQQQFYSDSDSDTDGDSDFDPLSDYDADAPYDQMQHGYNPAVDMAKRALDSLNHWPPQAAFDDLDDVPNDRNQPGQPHRKRRRYHHHGNHPIHPEMAYPRYDDPSDDYEDDDPYDEGNNFYDPYNVDPYNVAPQHASATAIAGNQMPGASAMASSSTFGPDGVGRSHVASDRSYLGPDGKWVRETFSNRDGEITSNVYPIDGPPPYGLHGDLPKRHRSRMDRIRAKHNKAMSKMAKKHRKIHERLMRKHEQNVNGVMARAQAVANGRGIF